jgi:hypothetical protein
MSGSDARAQIAEADATGTVCRVGFGWYGPWEDLIRAGLDARYAPWFVDPAKARLDDFDAVIPLQIEHYAVLARHPELRGHKFFHPSAEVVELCHDKLALTKFLIAEGFSSFVPTHRRSGAPYPYVWKRRHGSWGEHCHVVEGPQDERALDLSDDASFAQTLASGQVEFATHVLRVGGQIRYSSTFAFEMSGPALVMGALHQPLMRRFSRGSDHLALFSDILARLAYEGTACFDYKVVDGRPLLFEINPRYGGSLSEDVTAYLDAYVGALT